MHMQVRHTLADFIIDSHKSSLRAHAFLDRAAQKLCVRKKRLDQEVRQIRQHLVMGLWGPAGNGPETVGGCPGKPRNIHPPARWRPAVRPKLSGRIYTSLSLSAAPGRPRFSLKNYLKDLLKRTHAYAAAIHFLGKPLGIASGHEAGGKPKLGGLRHPEPAVPDSPYLTCEPHLAPDHEVLRKRFVQIAAHQRNGHRKVGSGL